MNSTPDIDNDPAANGIRKGLLEYRLGRAGEMSDAEASLRFVCDGLETEKEWKNYCEQELGFDLDIRLFLEGS